LNLGDEMKHVAIFALLALAGCGKQSEASRAPAAKEPVSPPVAGAAQSPMSGKGGEMKLIPIPQDKAQLAQLVSLGYTVHNDHMHPPGVKSCPFDKNGGSVIE
jgi:hypothetical protein